MAESEREVASGNAQGPEAAVSPQVRDDIVEREASRQVGEATAVKAKRAPDMPTRYEFEQHQASHEPYRSWCPACVAGSG